MTQEILVDPGRQGEETHSGNGRDGAKAHLLPAQTDGGRGGVTPEPRPSGAVSLLIFVVAVSAMGVLRLGIFPDRFITLTYALPLLLCLWHKDRRLLWSMAAAFVCMAATKAIWVVPDPDPRDFAEGAQFLMQVVNIAIVATTVDVILRLMRLLRAQNQRLEQTNEELAASEEEVRQQNEELQQQSEELRQQNEELQHGSEEMQQQGEELQVTNQQLNAREAMLQGILGSLGKSDDEMLVLEKVCETLVNASGESVAGAAVLERVEGQLVVRMHAGAESLRQQQWDFGRSFAAVVIQEDRTAFVDDLAARPDLIVPEPIGREFRSILATPLRLQGRSAGAVEVYSLSPRKWTKEEFRLVEWAAAQCSMAMEAVRSREELRRSNELTTAVNRISQGLHSTLDPEEVLRQIVVEGGAALGSDTAAITERKDGGWLVRYVHGMPQDMIGLRLEDEQERHALVALESGDALCVEDGFNDERFNREHLRRYNIRSVLLAPVVVQAEPYGVIFFNYHNGTHRFTEAEVNFARQLASCAASALGNARLFKQQREAALALRQNEEQFRAMFDIASVGKAQADPRTGRLLRVNAALGRMLGYSEAELLSRTFAEITHPDDRQDDWLSFSRMVRGEVAGYDADKRYVCRDGRIVWAHVSANVIHDPQGQPLRATAVIQDVTERKRAEQRLRDDVAALTRMHELSLRVLGGEGLDAFLQEVMDASVEIVGAQKGNIQLLEGVSLRIAVHHGHERPFLEFFANAAVRASACGEAIKVGKRIVVPDVEKSPIFDGTESLAVLREAQVRAVQSTPIMSRSGQLLGILTTHWEQPYVPDEHDLWRIDLLVRQAADVIEHARAEAQVQLARGRLEVFSRTISSLLTAADPQSVIEALCNDVRCFLNCDVFFNFLLDPKTRRLRFNACGGVDPRLARKVEGLELGASLCGTAARDGCRIHAENLPASEDPRGALVRSLGIRAYACHPLLSADKEVFGTLSFGTRSRDRFSAEDLDLMKMVTDHVAVAMLRRRGEEALSESEERFRTLADGTPVIIWVHDAEQGLRFVNKGYRDFFGVTREQVTGANWKPLVHPEDAPRYVGEFERSHAERRPYHAQARVRRHDGQWRWIESFGAPRFSSTGDFLGMAGTSADITERKEAEAVLARSKEELEQLVTERTAKLQELVGELEHFSYTLTHDMRAPLRAMRGIAEIISEADGGWSPEERAKFIGRIITAAERMDMLITDALSYNRAVRQELLLAPVDPGKLLRGMLETYPEFQAADVEISIQERFPIVMGNEAGLTQCFSNLLGNAVKFVKPGEKPKVRVWAELLNKETQNGGAAEWVRLWVEDNGIGISELMKPRVFDMFARGSSPQAGTGIGLALVRKVVDRMGGKVGVESEVGKGSRFWVELKAGTARAGGAELLTAQRASAIIE